MKAFVACVGTLFFSLGLTPKARAEAQRRVLIVDAIGLSPAMEKTNARQKMLEAVTATVSQHGWQPVLSANCHDFTCVGPSAAAASANYALILTGAFATGADALYATDVGVSFWRDGSVVARRSEREEQAEVEKTPGGEFFPCGPPNGMCIAPLLTSKMQQYSARLLEAESAAIQERVAAVAKPAIQPASSVLVAPAAAAPSATGSGVRATIGWSLIGVGAAGIAGGIALWAYGNTDTDCHSVPGSGCRQGRSTGTAAAVVGGIGAVAAVGGLVLVLDRGGSPVGVAASPVGLALGGAF